MTKAKYLLSLCEVQTNRTGNNPGKQPVVSGMYNSPKGKETSGDRADQERRIKEKEAEREMWREQTFPKPKFQRRRS